MNNSLSMTSPDDSGVRELLSYNSLCSYYRSIASTRGEISLILYLSIVLKNLSFVKRFLTFWINTMFILIGGTNMTNGQRQIIDDYFASILTRFHNMKTSEVDELGLDRAIVMIEGYIAKNTITPGEFQYIYDRTHPCGRLPKYNKSGKKHGLMKECPVEIMVEWVIDWSIPNHPIRSQLNENHDDFSDWYGRSPNK